MAAAGVGSTSLGLYLFGGALNDRIVESSISGLNGQSYSLAECIRIREEGRHAQPFRDELLGELGSIFRRMDLRDVGNIKIAIIPPTDDPSLASSGTRLLPGGSAYLVIPESIVLNTSLSRLQCDAAFDTIDVGPDDGHLIMNPATRYGIAHELAHIKHEDYSTRVLVAAASAALVLAVGPGCVSVLGLTRRSSSIVSMWAVAPGFFGYKWACREQERLADSAAGAAGYAQGGMAFWRQQIAFKNSRRPPGKAEAPAPDQLTLWRSHPPMAARYLNLKTIAEARRAHDDHNHDRARSASASTAV